MIEIVNLKKVIGQRVLFDNLNLTLNKGTFHIITGVSGSGKTTLLNIIGGLENNYDGDILIDGNNLSNHKRMKCFDFLFQNYGLVESESIKYNLEIVKKVSDEKLKELIKIVKLQANLKQKVYTLSGGEQQRLAIARLLLSNRDYILADEPTSSLDIENRDYIIDMLIELNKQGKTIILVSHDEAVLNRLKYKYTVFEISNND